MARYQCPGCAYVYDEERGDAHEGFPPGTRWDDIPDDWPCADCAVRDKADFTRLTGDPEAPPHSD